jgi:phosphatidylserine decarboxylase
MSKNLEEWIDTDVKEIRKKPLKQISEEYFFRDPCRPVYSDTNYMFSPADGVILYQKRVKADECIIDIKGKHFSLQDAMRDEFFDKTCLVIGIFMTMYDVHINRIPYGGYLSWKYLKPISTFNFPMLDVEQDIVDELTFSPAKAGYLHSNQRVLNRVFSPELATCYYILQIADYDVDCITPFELEQNMPVGQNERFSMIRFGSQVDLIVPLGEGYELETLQNDTDHVEAGLDPLIKIRKKTGLSALSG